MGYKTTGTTIDGSTNIIEGYNSSSSLVFSVNTLGEITTPTTAITKEFTGFDTPESVIINYDSTNRTITLTGTVNAYWQGKKISTLTSGWVSSAHTATNGSWFLYYNGSAFVWSQSAWSFDMLQIAFIDYQTSYKFALRETHGLMQWQAHAELHQTVGTYRRSGGDFTSYTLASTTAANRRPDISACLIKDEDLETTNPALTSKLYTQFYLTSTGTVNFTTGAADIIPLLTNNPYYNNFTGGNWIQTLFANNAYGAIFVLSAPVTADTNSQNFRYIFIQPQTTSTTLSVIQALTPNDLNLGSLVLSEYVFIQKIIIRYSGNNWTLIETSKITGNSQNSSTLTGSFLSSVSTSGKILSGTGTTLNPLTALNLDGFIDYNHNGTTQSYTSGDLKILNDGAGIYSLFTYKPLNITNLWNTSTNQFNFSELSIGDEVMIRTSGIVTTTANNQIFGTKIRFDIGGTPYELQVGQSYYKAIGTYSINRMLQFYIGNTGTLNNPAELLFSSDSSATLQVVGFYISVKRRIS